MSCSLTSQVNPSEIIKLFLFRWKYNLHNEILFIIHTVHTVVVCITSTLWCRLNFNDNDRTVKQTGWAQVNFLLCPGCDLCYPLRSTCRFQDDACWIVFGMLNKSATTDAKWQMYCSYTSFSPFKTIEYTSLFFGVTGDQAWIKSGYRNYRVDKVKLITADFPSDIKASAGSTNPGVLQASSDLSQRVANQISGRVNGDMVITADGTQSYKAPSFKRKWSQTMSGYGRGETTCA